MLHTQPNKTSPSNNTYHQVTQERKEQDDYTSLHSPTCYEGAGPVLTFAKRWLCLGTMVFGASELQITRNRASCCPTIFTADDYPSIPISKERMKQNERMSSIYCSVGPTSLK